MITYNHERFVEQAIKSVVSQETNFKFELLIHDDASPDKTQEIIKRYQQLYPNIIKSVLQTENQYSKGGSLVQKFLLPMAKGKYYAFIEGDDFWTDIHKLQRQADYLEAHPDIPAVSNRHYIVDAGSNIVDESHKGEECDRVFNRDDALRLGASTLHPNTIMMRMDIQRSEEYNRGRKQCCILGGHTYMIYYLCSHGGVYIFNEIMGAWRCVIEQNGTSYASRSSKHPVTYTLKLLEMYKRYQNFFGSQYDFSRYIAINTYYVIIWTLKRREENIGVIKPMITLFKRLDLQDILMIVKLALKKLVKELKLGNNDKQ